MPEVSQDAESARRSEPSQGSRLTGGPSAIGSLVARFTGLLCDTPVAAIGIVEGGQMRFSAIGSPAAAQVEGSIPCPAEIADGPVPFVVPDAAADGRFATGDLRTERGPIRFLAGAPMPASEGRAADYLCVLDTEPREFTPARLEGLATLGELGTAVLDIARADRDLRALLHTLDQHSIVSISDARGRILHANDKLCEISRHSREELLGQNHSIVNSGHHLKAFWSDMWRTIGRGESWRGDVCNRAKDGSLYWVDCIISPVHGADGKIEKFVSIRHDITERVKSEGALRESVHRLGMAARIADIGVWDWDLAADQVAADSKMFEMHGIEATADGLAPYSAWADSVLPEDRGNSERVLRETLVHGGTSEREFRVRRADGEVRVIRAVQMCVPGADGRVARMIGVNRDITELRDAEARILESREVIERQNAELSAMAERAHRVVDDVSHEFRTPLAVIKEFASIISDGLAGPVSTQQTEYLRIMGGAVTDLNHMVEDLLDSSKLRAGRLRVERKAHRVEDIFDACRASLARKASMRSITIEERVAPGLCGIFADEEKVRRIIGNLVSNAVKFSPEGSVITIAAEPVPGQGEIKISVSDQGPGLSREDIDQLFGRFQQTKSGRSAAAKGFGLGLGIAQELAWLNFGTLSVHSEKGHGASFWFTLPCSEGGAVLEHFLAAIVLSDRPSNELVLLRAESQPGPGAGPLDVGEFLASATYPSDLVLPAQDPGAWWVVGRTGSAVGWIRRLEKLRAEHDAEVVPAPPPLSIVLHSRWPYPQAADEAATDLARLLPGAVIHV